MANSPDPQINHHLCVVARSALCTCSLCLKPAHLETDTPASPVSLGLGFIGFRAFEFGGLEPRV